MICMFDLRTMTIEALTALISKQNEIVSQWLTDPSQPLPELFESADALRRQHYGRSVFLRGLIEYSNHCERGCLYCGLRAPNQKITRYRMSADDILSCVRDGYALGFRSFVLQGGEDQHDNAGHMIEIVKWIKSEFPDCALTLSCGEMPESIYKKLREAGADRYLLRHETANANHYARLHPGNMYLNSRKRCLWTLKKLGFAVGAGFMVGSPHQTFSHLSEDLIFIRELQPDMVGIGPFLPQSDTPFADEPPGSLSLTLTMIALTRMLLPHAPMPATTALGTLIEGGRELGIIAGANVVMPNITPLQARKHYLLYDGKIGVDSAIGDGLRQIKSAIEGIGLVPDFSRGDPVTQEVNI